MKKCGRFFVILLAAALTVGCAAALTACGDTANEYVVTKTFAEANKDEIPGDLINSVMLIYGVPDCELTTKLTLDKENKTYTLYKELMSPEAEDGSRMMVLKYEFYGAYTAAESDENSLTLKVPTSGRTSVIYTPPLSYNSIEKSTAGEWKSSEEAAYLLTRFNKWYPAKCTAAVDQPVTLAGDTMTFGDVTFPQPEPEPEPEPDGGEDEDMSGWGLDDSALVAVGAGGKALNFYADGTFKFVYNLAYSGETVAMIDSGVWAFSEADRSVTLTVTPEAGDPVVCSGEIDDAGKLVLNYVYSANTVITQTFELSYSQWSPLMPAAA